MLALIVILTTLDLVNQLNEPHLANIKVIYSQDYENMQDDLLTVQNQLGKSWKKITKKVEKNFDTLSLKLIELGKDLATEINKYFSNQVHELVIYVNSQTSSKITLSQSEIRVISESMVK